MVIVAGALHLARRAHQPQPVRERKGLPLAARHVDGAAQLRAVESRVVDDSAGTIVPRLPRLRPGDGTADGRDGKWRAILQRC